MGLNTQQTARERERARRIKGGDRRGADVRCWLLCSEAALKIRILINGASLPSSLHQQTKDGGRRSSISGTDRVSRRLRLRQISITFAFSFPLGKNKIQEGFCVLCHWKYEELN